MGNITSCQPWNTLQIVTKPGEVSGVLQHGLAEDSELREEGSSGPETSPVTPTCTWRDSPHLHDQVEKQKLQSRFSLHLVYQFKMPSTSCIYLALSLYHSLIKKKTS